MTEWTDFMKGKMSKYMKKYGGHAGAMKQLSKEYKAEQRKIKKKRGN